jgi:hypothetical protein
MGLVALKPLRAQRSPDLSTLAHTGGRTGEE